MTYYWSFLRHVHREQSLSFFMHCKKKNFQALELLSQSTCTVKIFTVFVKKGMGSLKYVANIEAFHDCIHILPRWLYISSI